ncbi:hypothetical protein SDRG_01998 [Saprolegnia diclina VS20]|uniref:Ion transport domain-containing protein n=1 Tax=Saprolegnia diclina (strain VS20) TaxID=1156394 RepID=T0R3M6_SAPDV|nr:hypothetical protein SDRG_01998 [Saprolegnia diclina VS20]EQC40935.1 hypothetical protein SDRG_01998 [Saprolegnia diclina VS20]|eukprot:XP_008605779.1 hypothetical protein SDRG_01998 [Saprolegnia diclina VS20]
MKQPGQRGDDNQADEMIETSSRSRVEVSSRSRVEISSRSRVETCDHLEASAHGHHEVEIELATMSSTCGPAYTQLRTPRPSTDASMLPEDDEASRSAGSKMGAARPQASHQLRIDCSSTQYETTPAPDANGLTTDRVYRERSQRGMTLVYAPTIREQLQAHMTSRVGVYLELINTSFSVLCCLFYLFQLYAPTMYDALQIQVVEITLTCYFALHYLVHFYTTEDVWQFVLSMNGVIDVITIVPAFIMFLSTTQNSKALTIFRVFRVFRALRVLRLYRLIRSRKHGYNYEWGVFTFSICAIIFVAAGIFQALEDYPERTRNIEFHDALYFILVTLATIGYGDIVATTTLSEVFVMGLIVAVVTVVPGQLTRLNALHKPRYAHDDAYRGRPKKSHVVVSGHIAHEAFADFLTEFYHPSRGVVDFDVVVLGRDAPSDVMTRLLGNVAYAAKTTYLKGSLMLEKDRSRVHLENAEAVFVLANRQSADHAAEDASTLLQALSVRNYADSTGRRVRTYLQMIADAHHDLSHIIGATQTLHTNRMKDDIVARGTVCPGACALILNLIQSIDEKKYQKHILGPAPWIQEYIGGMSRQIYAIVFSEAFDGHLFQDVARRVYHGFESILLAVYRRDKDEGHPRVCLGPFHKPILEGDIGFVVASSSYVVHQILADYSMLVHNEAEDASSRSRSTSFRHHPLISTNNLLHRQSPLHQRLSQSIRSPTDQGSFGFESVMSLDEAIRHATKKATKSLTQHVVLCGSLRHIVPVIHRLRRMYYQLDGQYPSLVLLCDTAPTPHDFPPDYALPSHVHFVIGSSLRCADLVRVGAPNAKAVLLYPYDSQQHFRNESSTDESSDTTTCLLDYGVVTSLLCLETASDLAHVALNAESAAAQDDLVFYASNRVPLSAVQDHLVCHYPNLNPALFRGTSSIQSMSARLRQHSAAETPESHEVPCVAVLTRGSNIKFCRPRDVHVCADDLPYLAPAYAAGRVFVDSRLDLLLCQAFYNPYITEVIHALAGSESDAPILRLVELPSALVGLTFGDLVLRMLSSDAIVLGLYRCPHKRLGNLLPYVYTSPPRETRLHSKDKVFLLAREATVP